MATIQVVLGLLCIIPPLFPGVGVSLAACAIGLGLIGSGLLAGGDDEESHHPDVSR